MNAVVGVARDTLGQIHNHSDHGNETWVVIQCSATRRSAAYLMLAMGHRMKTSPVVSLLTVTTCSDTLNVTMCTRPRSTICVFGVDVQCTSERVRVCVWSGGGGGGCVRVCTQMRVLPTCSINCECASLFSRLCASISIVP
jgi:hypothetical protein